MAAWYEPLEVAQWWYQADKAPAVSNSTPAIRRAKSPLGSWDMALLNVQTKQYYCVSTYSYAKGIWNTTDSPPALTLPFVL